MHRWLPKTPRVRFAKHRKRLTSRPGLQSVSSHTKRVTLDRGVGHIPGTGLPGGMGNVAVAGHRDGFFRVLKDIALGDQIEVLTAGEKYTYSVDQVVIVLPSDVSVLQSGSAKSLTLVTCYPFYFVGSAPKRYIVQAVLLRSEVLPVSERSSDESARAAW
jgi:sortase A